MTDRPIAAVLGAIAAIVFVAAFSAAAVMRPNQAAVAENGSSRTAPATASEESRSAALDSPMLTRVAALPALHLPKERKPAKRKTTKVSEPKVAPPVARQPVATPTAPQVTPTVAPAPRVVTPPRRSGGSNVGKTFDSEG